MNKTLVYITALLLAVSFIFYSCDTSAKKERERVKRVHETNKIAWDTLRVSKSENDILKNDQMICSLDVYYLVPSKYERQDIIDRIHTQIDSIVFASSVPVLSSSKELLEKYLDQYTSDCRSEYQEIRKEQAKGKTAKEFCAYNKQISSNLIYNEANLISYQVKIIERQGENTIKNNTQNILFDLVTGQQIQEKDIFKDNYNEALNGAIIEQLKRDKNVSTVKELQDMGYWGAGDIEANNNILVGDEGIIFTYNPEEYSDVKLGVLNILIYFEDLLEKDLLKSDSPISILYTENNSETSSN